MINSMPKLNTGGIEHHYVLQLVVGITILYCYSDLYLSVNRTIESSTIVISIICTISLTI